MAIPFLNNINLSDNQLQNAKLHITGTAPTASAGQIYYDSSDNKAKYYNGSAWIEIVSSTLGTVTSVSASISGDAYSALVTNPSTAASITISPQGDVSEYINGAGNLVTFPAIPQGDITEVVAGTYLSGGGTIGSVTLDHDSTTRTNTPVTASLTHGGTFQATTGVTTNVTGHVTNVETTTFTLPTDGLGVETVTSGNANTITIGGTAADPTVSANTASITNGGANLATGDQIYDFVAAQIATVPSGLSFEGNWNANTDSPSLAGTTPANGVFYIVSVDGSTSLSGITDWKVGDWAVYVSDGAGTDAWQKVDNTSTLSGAGATGQVSFWTGTANVAGDAGLTYDSSGNNLSVGNNITAGGTITSSGGNSNEWNTSYDNSITGLNVTGSTTKTLTATQQDGGTLTASWTDNDSGGTVTQINTSGPITGGPITGVGTIGITTASGSAIGAGNVSAGTGIDVSYSGGTATVSVDSNANASTTRAFTISDTATVNWGSTFVAAAITDVMIQLVDVTTYETVYADVERVSTSSATITFASTPTNDVRVLVSKIG